MPYFAVGKENSGEIEPWYEEHGSSELPVLLEAGYRVITCDGRGIGKAGQSQKVA
jgi:hypothetical protein